MTIMKNDGYEQPPENDERNSAPNVIALGLTLASAVAVVLTLLGCGVSYSVEAAFGLPHASIFESALDLSDLSGYAIAQLLNHGLSMLFDRALYGSMYGRSWPMMLIGLVASILLAVVAWRWGLKPYNAPDRKPKKPPVNVRSPAIELRKFALVSAVAFPLMPMIGAIMIGVVCVLCVLVAIAPMVGMVAGESYIKEWVVDPELCMPVRTREMRMHASASKIDATKLPKVSSCVVVSKDGLETARGRVILMTTKSAALFDPVTGSVRRIPIGESAVEVVSNLDVRAAVIPAAASPVAKAIVSASSASSARPKP